MDLFAIVFVVFVSFLFLGIIGTTAAFILMTLRSMWAHKATLDAVSAAVSRKNVPSAKPKVEREHVRKLVKQHVSINENGEYVLSPDFFDED